MTSSTGSTPGDARISRRQLFEYSGLAVAAVGGAQLLEACGSDSDGGGGKSGGILTHGATGGSSKDTLDAHAPVTNPDIARVFNLFEPLLFWDNDYKLNPALAEEVTPSADRITWTVKLRQGATFHNGKDVTPEDVLVSIRRVADPKAGRSAGVALAPIIDLNATKKVDATTVEIKRKTPYAALGDLLAEYTFGIVPEDYDPKNPVGTGAFKYKSFTPGKDSVFTKYADYWGVQHCRLAGARLGARAGHGHHLCRGDDQPVGGSRLRPRRCTGSRRRPGGAGRRRRGCLRGGLAAPGGVATHRHGLRRPRARARMGTPLVHALEALAGARPAAELDHDARRLRLPLVATGPRRRPGDLRRQPGAVRLRRPRRWRRGAQDLAVALRRLARRPAAS